MRSMVSTAFTLFLAPRNSVSPLTRPICVWRSPLWMQRCTSKVLRVNARFHSIPFTACRVTRRMWKQFLRHDELITSIELAPLPFAKRSLYRKVRDRASYAFALVSVAAALETENGKVRNVRLALGGVAPKPWRAFNAEKVLLGADVGMTAFREAADAELSKARGYRDNSFKIELARRTMASVLSELADSGGRP